MNRPDPARAGRGDALEVEVARLDLLLAEEQRRLDELKQARQAPERLVLFLEGVALIGVERELPDGFSWRGELEQAREVHARAQQAYDRLIAASASRTPIARARASLEEAARELRRRQGGALRFRLTPGGTPESRAAWGELLKRTSGLRDEVVLSVGMPQGTPIAASSQRLGFVRVPAGWFLLWAVAALLGLIGMVWAARNKHLLKVVGSEAYSLGRTQMAVWFSVIALAYLLLWAAHGAAPTLEGKEQLLWLLGFSVATTMGGQFIDKSAYEKSRKIQSLEDRLTKLGAEDAAKAEDASKAERDALKKELSALRLELAQLGPAALQPQGSRGFFADLVSDGSGPTIQRLQIVGWTLVLLTIFVLTAWEEMAFYPFSTEQLALLGVSSGTYVLFKIPEDPKSGARSTPATKPPAGAAKSPADKAKEAEEKAKEALKKAKEADEAAKAAQALAKSAQAQDGGSQ